MGAALSVCSTHNAKLGSSPGASVFGWDMLFDLQYLADWNRIGHKKQKLVNDTTKKENTKHVDFDHAIAIGDKLIIINKGVACSTRDKQDGSF